MDIRLTLSGIKKDYHSVATNRLTPQEAIKEAMRAYEGIEVDELVLLSTVADLDQARRSHSE